MITKQSIGLAMRRYGGSFVQAIGTALCHADSVNEAKLRATFPEYFEQYAEMARREMESPHPAESLAFCVGSA